MKPNQAAGLSRVSASLLGPSLLPGWHAECSVGSLTQAPSPRALPRDLCEACGLHGAEKVRKDDRWAPVDTGRRG